jgi:hypothetical protein
MTSLLCYADSIRGIIDGIQEWDSKETCFDKRTVSNESVIISNKFKLYPNPASDEICIKQTENAAIKQIKIIDIKGREMCVFSGEEKCLKIDFLPAGIYFARITDNNNYWETLKFVK